MSRGGNVCPRAVPEPPVARSGCSHSQSIVLVLTPAYELSRDTYLVG